MPPPCKPSWNPSGNTYPPDKQAGNRIITAPSQRRQGSGIFGGHFLIGLRRLGLSLPCRVSGSHLGLEVLAGSNAATRMPSGPRIRPSTKPSSPFLFPPAFPTTVPRRANISQRIPKTMYSMDGVIWGILACWKREAGRKCLSTVPEFGKSPAIAESRKNRLWHR